MPAKMGRGWEDHLFVHYREMKSRNSSGSVFCAKRHSGRLPRVLAFQCGQHTSYAEIVELAHSSDPNRMGMQSMSVMAILRQLSRIRAGIGLYSADAGQQWPRCRYRA